MRILHIVTGLNVGGAESATSACRRLQRNTPISGGVPSTARVARVTLQ